MSYVLITNSETWKAHWLSLLKLTNPAETCRCCKTVADFLSLELSENTVIYLDCRSVGLPQYLPYNRGCSHYRCSFVLVDTGALPDNGLLHFLKKGFTGVLKGGDKAEAEIKAIENLNQHRTWFPRRIVERAVRDYQSSVAPLEQVVYELSAAFNLSKREQQVCLALIQGKHNSEIAIQLFVSPHTVQSHITRLFHKLNIHSRHEILNAAYLNSRAPGNRND